MHTYIDIDIIYIYVFLFESLTLFHYYTHNAIISISRIISTISISLFYFQQCRSSSAYFYPVINFSFISALSIYCVIFIVNIDWIFIWTDLHGLLLFIIYQTLWTHYLERLNNQVSSETFTQLIQRRHLTTKCRNNLSTGLNQM